jgi:hypothetical protein
MGFVGIIRKRKTTDTSWDDVIDSLNTNSATLRMGFRARATAAEKVDHVPLSAGRDAAVTPWAAIADDLNREAKTKNLFFRIPGENR